MNKPTHPTHLQPQAMPDVQASADTRHLAIDQVGIARVRHPLLLRKADGSSMPTVGVFNMTVALPEDKKGTHMSRFIALLEERSGTPLDIAGFRSMLQEMVQRLEAQTGRIQMNFPYFVQKAAPVSGLISTMDYEVQWEGNIINGQTTVQIKVVVPVTSLCPCSKQISAYGAHNQRSHVTVAVTLAQDVLLDELIRTIEDQGSCELWGMLKRTDEKYVTERAYDNPKFVEDLVRDVAASIKADQRIQRFVVEAENFESIHNHSAYAMISG